ncbi:MAG: ASKHA domain-containing protein [Hominenteromicrobium sp.]
MAELVIFQDGSSKTVAFTGEEKLSTLLQRAGAYMPHPCGGRGSCGKCAVTVTGAVSEPNESERRAGVRLSCQVVVTGDASVTLPDSRRDEQIETGTGTQAGTLLPMPGQYGAAVDIGTTTLAVKLFDLKTGVCVGTAAALNPQTAVAADVMGRIGAAMAGSLGLLQTQVTEEIDRLLGECRAQAGIAADPESLVLTGNTTMLYLLTGRDPACLSHAPFEADTLFGGDAAVLGRHAYLPPCMNAFVGADITCAVLASGMCEKDETALLCDIGTNGEMALWKDGTLYVTSTAAGPAFEGAGISCGCGSVRGAIDRVWLEDGALRVHTLGDADAVGICGSGLIDAVAAALQSERIDETGFMEEDCLPLSGSVALLPRDIRAVQLAKAAIAAGMEVLLETAGISFDDVRTLYIAGGFGSHLNVESAAVIGLLPPELTGRTRIIGNAALSGAVQALLNLKEHEALERIASLSKHVNLGGSPRFNEKYVEQMLFGSDE